METATVRRCFVRFHGFNSLKRALARARKLAREFPQIKIVEVRETKEKVVRIAMHIPENLIHDVSRIPGVSMLIVDMIDYSATGFWVYRIAGRIVQDFS